MNRGYGKRLIMLALVSMLVLAGCSNTTPRLEPALTPIPTVTIEPQTPTPEATMDPSDSGDGRDALGNPIIGSDHFQQYLRFENIRVFEAHGDTFLDGYVVNSYPEALNCAVWIEFYDENEVLIASAGIQGPDGSFMLSLENGRTPIFASIPADETITDREFVLRFDEDMPAAPAGF